MTRPTKPYGTTTAEAESCSIHSPRNDVLEHLGLPSAATTAPAYQAVSAAGAENRSSGHSAGSRPAQPEGTNRKHHEFAFSYSKAWPTRHWRKPPDSWVIYKLTTDFTVSLVPPDEQQSNIKLERVANEGKTALERKFDAFETEGIALTLEGELENDPKSILDKISGGSFGIEFDLQKLGLSKKEKLNFSVKIELEKSDGDKTKDQKGDWSLAPLPLVCELEWDEFVPGKIKLPILPHDATTKVKLKLNWFPGPRFWRKLAAKVGPKVIKEALSKYGNAILPRVLAVLAAVAVPAIVITVAAAIIGGTFYLLEKAKDDGERWAFAMHAAAWYAYSVFKQQIPTANFWGEAATTADGLAATYSAQARTDARNHVAKIAADAGEKDEYSDDAALQLFGEHYVQQKKIAAGDGQEQMMKDMFHALKSNPKFEIKKP